ncbi:MAG TPA: hypothetical protein VLT36_01375, partial [Candidatus Dormibacteraeota bacterium]|nr:hypothetical protein [Candidatus Dormibacteraeota bacterium]
RIANLFGGKPQKSTPLVPETLSPGVPSLKPAGERKQAYSKVFRWRLPDGHTKPPASVEVAGSFNHWQKLPLNRDGELDAWHVTVQHIEGHRTHHYMLFVDGQPIYDKGCDGLAVPSGPQEESFALKTDRGLRVLMLFAQTK